MRTGLSQWKEFITYQWIGHLVSLCHANGLRITCWCWGMRELEVLYACDRTQQYISSILLFRASWNRTGNKNGEFNQPLLHNHVITKIEDDETTYSVCRLWLILIVYYDHQDPETLCTSNVSHYNSLDRWWPGRLVCIAHPWWDVM